MQSALKIIVSLLLLSSALASYHNNAKLRRDGVLNLYPFPRVGRASTHTWEVPLNDFLLEYEPVQKRQLYAFPRVGRSEIPGEQEASARREDGMWFGPRVGRSDLSPREYAARASDQAGMWFGPRVGRSEIPMPAKRAEQIGMWFGPRLGRSYKSDDDDTIIQNESNDRSESEQAEPTHGERKKRNV